MSAAQNLSTNASFWPLSTESNAIHAGFKCRDYLPWKRKSFPFPLFNAGLGVLIALTGNRLGFWHGITARKLESLGHAGSQTVQRRRMVQRVQMHVQEAEAFRPTLGFGQRAVQFRLRFHKKPAAGTQDFGQTVIVPRPHVIVRTVLHLAFRAETTVVQQHHHLTLTGLEDCGLPTVDCAAIWMGRGILPSLRRRRRRPSKPLIKSLNRTSSYVWYRIESFSLVA